MLRRKPGNVGVGIPEQYLPEEVPRRSLIDAQLRLMAELGVYFAQKLGVSGRKSSFREELNEWY